MRVRRAFFVLPAGILVLAGCSSSSTDHTSMGGGSAPAGRTIEVEMTEHRYTPDQFVLKGGETVTFRFTNRGTEAHEAVLGDATVQDQHHREMLSGTTMPGQHGAGHGDAPGAMTVPPGQSMTMSYTAPMSGPVLIGCHRPNHWEGGMKAMIAIT